VNWNLRSNDTDIDGTGETLTHNTWSTPLHGIVTQTGTSLNYAPTLNYCGADTFDYTIKDQNNAVSNTGTVTITVTCVNDAPVVIDDSGSIAQSGSGFLPVLTNDTDLDTGDTKTISGHTLPVYGAIVKTATGFSYTANASYCGVDTFSYRIADGSGLLSNTGTVTVTITPCDTVPPVLVLT
jgi:large repetitive protein